jgi:lipopolysaccharide transport system permease protein
MQQARRQTEYVSMRAAVNELFAARELLLIWTWREFRVRYSQSVLGVAWAIIQPFVLMVVFSVIFSLFLRVPTGGVPYPVLAYSGLLAWVFFANAIGGAMPSLVGNLNLVTKIAFPREVLPLATLFVSLIDFLIAAVIFAALLLYYQIPLHLTVGFVPLLVFVQFIFSLGLSLFGAALNVFYRDIRFVIPLVLQTWMYLSPVFYPLEVVPERWRSLFLLNPMATLIDSYRRVLIFGQAPDWTFLGITTVLSVLTLALGYWYFKRAEATFADRI